MSAPSTKDHAQQKILDYVTKQRKATAEEVAAGVGIGRTSARKHLAALEADGKLRREPGGREGRRKLPDRFSPAKARRGRSASKGAKGSGHRLKPGELDKLVLAYLRQHRADGPLTASKVGKAIERSSGAVANCLNRMAKSKAVRQVGRRPRTFLIAEERPR